jgi:endogenous inhibitor of DNA gyrase (YacG/DUF329 family)
MLTFLKRLFGAAPAKPPTKQPVSLPTVSTTKPAPVPTPPYPGVSYKEKERNNGNTYEVYAATSKSIAMKFLRQFPVTLERHYVICESPQGNVGKDMIMIFDEGTQKRIEYGTRKPLPQIKLSTSNCSKCGYPVLPASERSTRFAGSHGSDAEDIKDIALLKEKGVGFLCAPCRAAFCIFCADENNPTECPICQKHMELLSDKSRLALTLPPDAGTSETCPKCGSRVPKLIPVTDFPSGETRRICHACAGAVSGSVGEVYNL